MLKNGRLKDIGNIQKRALTLKSKLKIIKSKIMKMYKIKYIISRYYCLINEFISIQELNWIRYFN